MTIIGLGWTDTRCEILKRLATAGLSASQIAAELGGVTRNAVIGKLTRMRVPLKGTPSQKPLAARAARPPIERRAPVDYTRVTRPVGRRVKIRPGVKNDSVREVMILEPTEIIDLAPDTSEFACTIVDLKAGMCRWIMGDKPTEWRYCGTPCVGSWCRGHRSIVFIRPERRER